MIRTEIVRWFVRHRDNILRNMKYCMPGVLPIGEDYVYKNTLGIKFFVAKKCIMTLPYNIKSIYEMPDFFESTMSMKTTTIFEEIYFVDYNSENDSLIYVYAKDVKSGCYDTHMGLAIDLTKIPKTAISGNVWTSLHNSDDYQILTLDELFVYKDILQS